MKKLALLFFISCFSTFIIAQTDHTAPCGFDTYIQEHQRIADTYEIEIQNFLSNKKIAVMKNQLTGSLRIIPVVVHVIHNNGAENISDAQIQSQIQILNEDYRKIPFSNGDGNGVDTEIEFCLAKISPDGDCTDGIVRVQSTLTNLQAVQDGQLKALSHWDPERYLNIYVVKTISGNTVGYASFPGGPPNEDGLVCEHSYFGNIGTASASLGRTATHEIGHWLGLYHTFNGGCGIDTCSAGDYVCDTPPAANPNYGCSLINSCNIDFPDVDDQIQNYMDYTNDACKNMFTAGQKARIRATLDTLRFNIWQVSNLVSTGCDSGYVSAPCPAIADFTCYQQTICVGNTILFTNRSLNNPTSYQWNFPGGTPSSSTSINPTVTYNTVGTYNVSLIATNNYGTDTVIFNNYITVTNPSVGLALPYTEGFETNVFPPNGITIDNPDAGITWEIDTAALPFAGSGSVKINNLINTNYGQTDAMVLPNLDFTSFASPYISFRWAYAKSDPNYSDELSVQISTDCGVNFTQIFYRSGTALTTGITQTTPYLPDSSTVWKVCNVSLAPYASSDHAIIKIVNVTDGGNNLYIDNINIGANTFLGTAEKRLDAISLYPNPGNGTFQLQINDWQGAKGELEIFDVCGEKIYQSVISKGQSTIQLNSASGVYFVHVKSGTHVVVKKLIIQ